MFDGSLPGPAELAQASDADLVTAVSAWARASAAADARKLAAIAEIQRRACTDAQHQNWAADDLDAAAATLSCALTISHGRALGQLDLAVTLRDRLPKLGARFLAGDIPAAMISTIMFRTGLVLDAAALARIDTEIADRAHTWGPLSQYKLEQSIDFWVNSYDPDAVRRVRNSARGRDFTIGDRDDATGTASVYGRLTITDAMQLEQRITAMITSVCEDDPRTLGQRRSDAVGAIAALATHLRCRCDNPTCPGKTDDGPTNNVIIHVIADKESLDQHQDPNLHGPGFDKPPTKPDTTKPPAQPDTTKPDTTEPDTTKPDTTEPPRRRKAALIPGAKGAIVPAPLLAELIAHGAKVRFVGAPDDHPQDRYRPSVALQEFIRSRDLTCRFPGCDRPAAHADIDHTIAWPTGATHPANLKCYCRLHHLIKTFWHGWTDQQDPDGTLTITTPNGLTYTTKPFSQLLFPKWNTTTPPPPAAQATAPTGPGRHLMMPTRRRTRAQSRTARITTERHHNATQRALENQQAATAPQRPVTDRWQSPYEFPAADHTPDYGDDPPPF